MTRVEQVIQEIAEQEKVTGKPPAYLKMSAIPFEELVAEMCKMKGMSRQATRQEVRSAVRVMVLNVVVNKAGI